MFCCNCVCNPVTTSGLPKDCKSPVFKLHGSRWISCIIPTNDLVSNIFWKCAILPIKIVMISEIRLRINGMTNTIAHKKTMINTKYANAIAKPLYLIFAWTKSMIASIAREMTYAINIR